MSILDEETDIDERIEIAQKKAKMLLLGQVKTLDDFVILIRLKLALFYRIPLYSQYFTERTVDELLFEYECISITSQPNSTERTTSDLINENKEGLDGLFDDLPKDDEQSWVNQTGSGQEDQFKQDAEKFMKEGKFKGET